MINSGEVTGLACAPHAFLERERELHRRAEASGQECIWFWELERPTVVAGHSTSLEAEVNVTACQSDGVPVLRRDSGGGAVVLGAGCLNYTLILNLERRPDLRAVEDSHRFILDAAGRATGAAGVTRTGTDLTIGGKKFGGSSQRRWRRTLLQHGTILYAFELSDVARYLREPARRPAYRQQRTHGDFLTNLPLDRGEFAARLKAAFPEAELVS
jgi:lipoate-protein ligase A